MSLMFPKPEKPVRGNKAAKEWMELVAQLPCVCCSRPSEVLHHCIHGRFSRTRPSDFDVLPMCVAHHVMLHDERSFWQVHWNNDVDWLPFVAERVAELKARTVS